MRLTESILRKIIAEESAKILAPRKRSLASYIFEEVQWGSKYEAFVSALAGNANDPKVKAFISAGQLDKNPDDDKFTFAEIPLPVSKLRPTQNEIDVDKSLSYPMAKPSDFVNFVKGGKVFAPGGNAIVTYNGQYVIDGHHRWSQVYACNSEASIQAIDIQLPGLNPLDVLKAVQAAIAISAGKVPMQSVKGSNLLKVDKAGLESWMSKSVSMKFYGVIGSNPEVMEILRSKVKPGVSEADEPVDVSEESYREAQDLVINYIWKNVSTMQAESQPVDGAPKRDFMPQTDDVDWKTPLEKGLVDIAEPHADPTQIPTAAESRSRYDDLIIERWQKMAGLLK